MIASAWVLDTPVVSIGVAPERPCEGPKTNCIVGGFMSVPFTVTEVDGLPEGTEDGATEVRFVHCAGLRAGVKRSHTAAASRCGKNNRFMPTLQNTRRQAPSARGDTLVV